MALIFNSIRLFPKRTLFPLVLFLPHEINGMCFHSEVALQLAIQPDMCWYRSCRFNTLINVCFYQTWKICSTLHIHETWETNDTHFLSPLESSILNIPSASSSLAFVSSVRRASFSSSSSNLYLSKATFSNSSASAFNDSFSARIFSASYKRKRHIAEKIHRTARIIHTVKS